jgi:hypothetical protein
VEKYVNGSNNCYTRVSEELLVHYRVLILLVNRLFFSYFNYYTDPDGNLVLEYLGGLSGSILWMLEGTFKLKIKDANGNGEVS